MEQLYYIPTSTLNFNNILSSESISPKAFYTCRKYGYSRWFDIPENALDYAILLYKEPFHFERPSGDMEDHPMWVEVKMEEGELSPTGVEGVYYIDRPIYLTPWTCRFIFFSKQVETRVRSLSSSSLETKMGLYEKLLKIEDYPERNVCTKIQANVPLNKNALEKDQLINRHYID